MSLLDFIIRKKHIPNQSERHYYVKINNTFVSVHNPPLDRQQINWKDIEEIRIITKDEGPIHARGCLALYSKDKKCILPQDIPEYHKVYGIISQFDNFNFENVIASIGCKDDREFLIWRKN